VLRVIQARRRNVIDLDCDIGYLHRGHGKNCREPHVLDDRPLLGSPGLYRGGVQRLVWVETVEQVMGLAVPPRAHYIRTILD